MEITIRAYQEYLRQRYSGWTTEQGLFMKLVEECGEVAEVLNQRAGYKKTFDENLSEELGTELADMIHYIVAIAAINGIDLNAIMLQKDKRASAKYHHDTNLEQFLREHGE